MKVSPFSFPKISFSFFPKLALSFCFLFLSLSLIFTLSACQSTPHKALYKALFSKEKNYLIPPLVSEGRWDGHLFLKKGKKSHYLRVYLQAVKNKKLRLDIVTKLYLPLLSMAINNDNLQYLFIQEKKFYYGKKANIQSLKPFLPIPFDPKLLFSFLFDQKIKDRTWSCKKNEEKHHLVNCKNSKLNLTIQLETFPYGNRTISIQYTSQKKKNSKGSRTVSNKDLSITLSLTNFYPKIKHKRKDLFQITPPAGYQTVILE